MKKYNLEGAIEKRRIISFSNGPKLVYKELREDKEDLRDAKDLFSRGMGQKETFS